MPATKRNIEKKRSIKILRLPVPRSFEEDEKAKKQAEFSLFGKDGVGTSAVIVEETVQMCIDRLESEARKKESLIENNKRRIREYFANDLGIIEIEAFEYLNEIVRTYTNDLFEDCLNLLIVYHDALIPLLIRALTSSCMTFSSYIARERRGENWIAKQNVFSFLDSDEYRFGDSFYLKTCSEDHTKCRWLSLFLSLLPKELRFGGSNSTFFTTNEEEIEFWNIPFGNQLFMYCMQYGADCQKIEFLSHGKSLGATTIIHDGYKINQVHILCCQGNSLKRIQYFMTAGFDIHCFAAKVDSGRLFALKDYIKAFWPHFLQKKKENGEECDSITRKYYYELPKMIRRISNKMKDFVTCEHRKKFSIESGMRFNMPITYPHVIRCNPEQNKINRGDGKHFATTCLFFEQGCSLETGISEGLESNKKEKHCSEVLSKCRKDIKTRKGKFVLCVYHVDIIVAEEDEEEAEDDEITLPEFEFIESDEGMSIESASILPMCTLNYQTRQNFRMIELPEYKSPGKLVYGFDVIEDEIRDLRPGPALIEIQGHFDDSINILAQLLFIKEDI